MSTPKFTGFNPSSIRASAAARGASKKSDTRPECYLRKTLWSHGLRYRKNVANLPGKPDLAFFSDKVVIFCDGDFWHGRNWDLRKDKLRKGNNSKYWIAKIESNMKRDRQKSLELINQGWKVLRFWESDIMNKIDIVVDILFKTLKKS